jgi:hypothetical protein
MLIETVKTKLKNNLKKNNTKLKPNPWATNS